MSEPIEVEVAPPPEPENVIHHTANGDKTLVGVNEVRFTIPTEGRPLVEPVITFAGSLNTVKMNEGETLTFPDSEWGTPTFGDFIRLVKLFIRFEGQEYRPQTEFNPFGAVNGALLRNVDVNNITVVLKWTGLTIEMGWDSDTCSEGFWENAGQQDSAVIAVISFLQESFLPTPVRGKESSQQTVKVVNFRWSNNEGNTTQRGWRFTIAPDPN